VTRIIAGVAGGRRLDVPAGRGTRPTSDRVREALFSSLGDLDSARVLDLYAGSGAFGLEALSRGAAHALLVESAPAALAVLRANVSALQLPGAAIAPTRVERLLAVPPDQGPYDVVLLDPPYADPVDPVLSRLVDGGWLAPGAQVVVERGLRSSPPAWPPGLLALRSRRYGQTCLWYGLRS
jgi:16S rRNA (guanine966-N2)-methyltransferase